MNQEGDELGNTLTSVEFSLSSVKCGFDRRQLLGVHLEFSLGVWKAISMSTRRPLELRARPKCRAAVPFLNPVWTSLP